MNLETVLRHACICFTDFFFFLFYLFVLPCLGENMKVKRLCILFISLILFIFVHLSEKDVHYSDLLEFVTLIKFLHKVEKSLPLKVISLF